ncbi:hypothetical protein I4F81_004298 [Pyropia yezoensis]|uniref:Uncharacterized protein n=1 Tax=Pyropia yezoensis TaxID=2788 RepID=A0ACC3BVS2_PYRYE|nr:hypothetical protein I4F81_004298 [Neopyropia yezoensis]
MGSRCLFRLNQPDRKLLPTAERELCRRAEAHTGTRLGGWDVHAMALAPPAAAAEPARRGRGGMDVLSLSEAPTKRYVVYTPLPPPGGGGKGGGTAAAAAAAAAAAEQPPPGPVAVEADEQLPHILLKVSGYTPRVVKGIKSLTRTCPRRWRWKSSTAPSARRRCRRRWWRRCSPVSRSRWWPTPTRPPTRRVRRRVWTPTPSRGSFRRAPLRGSRGGGGGGRQTPPPSPGGGWGAPPPRRHRRRRQGVGRRGGGRWLASLCAPRRCCTVCCCRRCKETTGG